MHITHRGVNRAAVFIDDVDRATYLHLLGEALPRNRVALHAYVLMGNHVHLLLSSLASGAISCALRNSIQCYVQWFNRRHGRTGTLWEGRYKSCLVDSDRHLLCVIRYIELNPVRAAMVAQPTDYRWSSVHAHLALRRDPKLSIHPVFLGLGDDPELRAANYRTWLMEPVGEAELIDIRRHVRQQRALGEPRFQAMVERTLNRPAACRRPGRPSRIAD